MVFFNLESKKSNTSVPHTTNQGENRECEKENFSNGSRKNNLVLKDVTLTVTRSQRISRSPSDWWVVKSDQSKYFYLNCLLGAPQKSFFKRLYVDLYILSFSRENLLTRKFAKKFCHQ